MVGLDLLTFGTSVLMFLALLLILVPAVPVTILEWCIAMLYFALSISLTGATYLTIPSLVIMTLLAFAGGTAQLWMPLLGLQGRQLSCGGLVAFFAGMMVGSIFIPIPVLGTIIGGVAGVMLSEFGRADDWREAMKSGGAALKLVIMSMLAEFVFAFGIVAVFLFTVVVR